ncbi:DUF2934 domain-containing protein [Belnapia moabensis]|uniref:DUF2934 domain-containing protein n=1 Tax=Belnapia moabensis TaxID=365533 RepID=UPI000A057C68|nr:DUF2934 domain-containing protein [Belnapia moabensis]
MSATATELESRVRERAYYLWEQEGRPEGRAEEFWARAAALEAAVQGDHGEWQREVGEGHGAQVGIPPKRSASAQNRAKAVDGATSFRQAGQRRKSAMTPRGPRQKAGVATEAVT